VLDDTNALADMLREILPEPRVTRVVHGIVYSVPAWGCTLDEGRLVDTDGHQVGPGCADAVGAT
jgi:hypothetical protein